MKKNKINSTKGVFLFVITYFIVIIFCSYCYGETLDQGVLIQINPNDTQSPKGNLILVAGGDIDNQIPYSHTIQALANSEKVYQIPAIYW